MNGIEKILQRRENNKTKHNRYQTMLENKTENVNILFQDKKNAMKKKHQHTSFLQI